MAAKRGRPPKPKVEPKEEFRCSRCGAVYPTATGKFFKTRSSIHNANDQYGTICIKCINELFEDFRVQYDDQELATIICCHYLDVPFYRGLYDSTVKKNENFTMGHYLKSLACVQYHKKTFVSTLVEGELAKDIDTSRENSEENWSVENKRNKNEVIKIVGYDPFVGYSDRDRKYLFSELLKWLDDDELLEDTYKMTQVIQIVNNNNQIKQCDLAISRLDAYKNLGDVSKLNNMKKDLVTANDKIAKENGISAKNRTDQKAGKNSLTGLMRDMREKELIEIEANYYDQLRSENSRWASEVSFKSMKENCYFDENDVNDIIDYQRETLSKLQLQLEDSKEENRLLRLEEIEKDKEIKRLEMKIKKLGGRLNE